MSRVAVIIQAAKLVPDMCKRLMFTMCHAVNMLCWLPLTTAQYLSRSKPTNQHSKVTEVVFWIIQRAVNSWIMRCFWWHMVQTVVEIIGKLKIHGDQHGAKAGTSGSSAAQTNVVWMAWLVSPKDSRNCRQVLPHQVLR